MVNDNSLFAWSDMLEASRPSFEGFEAEGKRILARRKAITLINHGFAFGEHVPSLEVGHPKISIAGGSNVLRPMIVAVILFGFNIGNLNAVRLRLMQFVGRNGRNRVIRWRISGLGMRIRVRPVKFIGIDPLHTFIAGELEGNPLSPSNDGADVNINLPVHGVPGEIDIFISLNKEIGHADI